MALTVALDGFVFGLSNGQFTLWHTSTVRFTMAS